MRLFFLAFCLIIASSENVYTQISVITMIPDTVHVCPETFQIKVFIINPNSASVAADSVDVIHSFEPGINLVDVDTAVNVDSFDISNSNAPTFYAENLGIGDTMKLYLTVQIDCNFSNSQAEGTTDVIYFYGSTLINQSTVSDSYNILKPALDLTVSLNSNIYANIGDTVEREIKICNNGFQELGSLELDIISSSDVRPFYYSLRGVIADSIIGDGTTFSFMIDNNLLNHVTGNNFLGVNECIWITERILVDSCNGIPTTYSASYGCDSVVCEQNSDDASVAVVTGNPLVDVQVENDSTIETGYCDTTFGRLVFEYSGSGTDASGVGVPANNSYSTDLKVYLRYTYDFVNIKSISIAEKTIGDISGLSFAGTYDYLGIDSILCFDLTTVDSNFAPGILFDLDNDGFYDDLPNGSSFYVAVNFELSCDTSFNESPRTDYDSRYFIMNAGVSYNNQCGDDPVDFNITNNDGREVIYHTGADAAVLTVPADIEENDPFVLDVCPFFSQFYSGDIDFHMPCMDDSLIGVVHLPPGYGLPPGVDSITIVYNVTTASKDSIRLKYIETADSLIIPIGPLSTVGIDCFSIPLVLTCLGDSTVANFGTDEFIFELIYVCNAGCLCSELMSVGEASTFHHCLGDCDKAIQTTSFDLERATFGWADTTASKYYTITDRDLAPKVTSDTVGIRLDAAYPLDTICARAKGVIGTLTGGSGIESVFLQIRYQTTTADTVFDFSSGKIEIIDSTGTLVNTCIIGPPTISDSGSVGNRSYFMDFHIPTSCMPGGDYQSGDTLSSYIYLQYRKETAQELFAGPISYGFELLDNIRAEYMLKDTVGDTITSCDHWGANFWLLKPGAYLEFYQPQAECSEVNLQFRIRTFPAFMDLEIEDFPNEFRNSLAINDTIIFHLNRGWKYAGEATYVINNQYGSNFKIFALTPDLILSDDKGDTLIRFVRDWEQTDCYLNPVQSGFQNINVLLQPTCSSESGSFSTTATIVQNHYSEEVNFHDSLIYVFDSTIHASTMVHKKPGLYVPTIAEVTSVKHIISWDFQYCNTLSTTNTDADYAWLAFENPSGDLQLMDVILNGTDTLTSFYYSSDSSKLFAQVDTLLLDNTCLDLSLFARNMNCTNPNELDSVVVLGGYDCLGFPINADSACCLDTLANFKFTVELADITMIGNVPDSLHLCESMPYSFSVTNTDYGTICTPILFMDLPLGISIDSAFYNYPVATAAQMLPASSPGFGTGGDYNGWNLDSNVFNDQGLTGIADSSTNTIDFTIFLSAACNYSSTEFITFNFQGINTCSDTITETHQSLPPVLIGLNGMNETALSMLSGGIDNCDSVSTVTISIVNMGDTPSGLSDSLILSFQNSMNYNNGFIDIHNAPTVSVPEQSMSSGMINLSWNLPSGIMPGDSSVFSFEIALNDTLICTPMELIGTTVISDIFYCGSTGDSCLISQQSGLDSLTLVVGRPNAEFIVPSAICLGDTVNLYSEECGNHFWDLDDGSNSPDSNAYHVYAAPGNYVVKHYVVGLCNEDSASHIVVVNDLPLVDAGSDQVVCEGDSLSLNGSGAGSYIWNNGIVDGTVFIATSTASYTVEGVDTNGCVGTDEVVVTVNALPIVDAGPDRSLCENDSTSLIGSGASSYTWDNGIVDGVAFTPVTTTAYNVLGTDSNGCENTDQVVITVDSIPTVAATSSNDSVCQGSEAVDLMGSPTGGTFSGPGVNGTQFEPLITGIGSFHVIYSYTDSTTGCTGNDTLVIVVMECVGFDEHDYGYFVLFPNPADGAFTLQIPPGFRGKIEVTNSVGQVIYRREIQELTTAISLGKSHFGLYFVSIYDDNGLLEGRKKLLIK
ncbi:MAG: T9SS type A sorting domain-containing protein [Flavobacteriales bacterium]|nr:T9SS type A sorting domain-containing protein [Flavobacteriales bacterium]